MNCSEPSKENSQESQPPRSWYSIDRCFRRSSMEKTHNQDRATSNDSSRHFCRRCRSPSLVHQQSSCFTNHGHQKQVQYANNSHTTCHILKQGFRPSMQYWLGTNTNYSC
ncbi:uncharacterized protein LJ206_013230 isoform 1-T1 [Theristicus caerulescens]